MKTQLFSVSNTAHTARFCLAVDAVDAAELAKQLGLARAVKNVTVRSVDLSKDSDYTTLQTMMAEGRRGFLFKKCAAYTIFQVLGVEPKPPQPSPAWVLTPAEATKT